MGTVSISRMDVESSPGAAASGSTKALVKGLALVDLVSGAGAPVRLTDLVDASGLPRSTALRLLQALVERRVLQIDPSGGYALGPQLAVWGQRYLDVLDVRRHAEEFMSPLSEETRETCFLGVRDGRRVLYVAKVDGPQAVRPAAQIGTRNPLHSTAIGKALLAHAPLEVKNEYLDQNELERRTPDTITDPAALREELELTRERGYAIDNIENEDGVRCVGAPVCDHGGAVIAAMSVAAPAYRFELDDLPRLAPRVLDAARGLSARIGHRTEER
jgi:DNA-binding IclR family transcriptional regulator